MDEIDSQHVIREWGTSRYREDKKWVKGVLKLGANFLCFQEAESDKGLILSLDCITGLRMDKTWLVFNTVVLLVGHKSYWFSSFTCASPYVVLHTIEHFWKEGLLVTADQSVAGSKLRTKLGKEMLVEAHEAQATLAAAASDLHHQGEQLEDCFNGLDGISRDLQIAESNLSNMESWLGRWRVRPIAPTAKSIPTDNVDVVEYSILYALKPRDAQKPGYFSIHNKVIKLSNSKHDEVLSFRPDDVSSITVPTPWELVIVRRMIGQPDVYACVTSAKLIYMLRLLQPVYGRKLEYEDPYMHSHIAKATAKQLASSQKQKLQELLSSATEISQNHLKGASITDTTTLDPDRPIGQQLQSLHQSQGVTDSEADELSQVLRGLKSLATEIAPELDRQDQLIGQLTQEVSDTSDRITKDNKRINRLL